MWVKIKENTTTTAWYKNHKGEIFEVYVAPYWGTENPEPLYVVETEDDIFVIDAIDADVVNIRREKLNKIKNKL